MLHPLCGKRSFGRCHGVHGVKPSAKRQLAVFHHRPFRQGNVATTLLALERPSPLATCQFLVYTII